MGRCKPVLLLPCSSMLRGAGAGLRSPFALLIYSTSASCCHSHQLLIRGSVLPKASPRQRHRESGELGDIKYWH